MKKLLLKFTAVYAVLYVLNNLYYWNKPWYQQHPTEALSYFQPAPDTTLSRLMRYPRLDTECQDSIDQRYRKKVVALMNEMAAIENPDGDPFVVNASGYMGKYQFGQSALKEHRIKLRPSQFRRNHSLFPEHLQDKVFLRHCVLNKTYLEKDIEKYSGRKMKNIRLSETNIVAAGHCGIGRVELFLHSNGRIDKRDGNGTPVSLYLRKFEKHNIDFEKALTVI